MWRYVLLLFEVFSILQTILGETPRGHMKPLGEHRSAENETEEIIDDLHPQQFWKQYVKAGIPVLFPGAAKNSE
jgi:aminopeptidase C